MITYRIALMSAILGMNTGGRAKNVMDIIIHLYIHEKKDVQAAIGVADQYISFGFSSVPRAVDS